MALISGTKILYSEDLRYGASPGNGWMSSRWRPDVNFAYGNPPTGFPRDGVSARDLRLHELDAADCTRLTEVIWTDSGL
jgi:hypothetical protein